MGLWLLAVWLSLTGLGHFVPIPPLSPISGVLAIVAGMLLLVGR